MSSSRRRPEEQPLGRCFWCGNMVHPGGLRLQGEQDYLLLHVECAGRLVTEVSRDVERAKARPAAGAQWPAR